VRLPAGYCNVCDSSSVAEQRLPNPRCRGFDSFLSRWSSGGPQAPGSLDVYPNRVTGSRRNRDAFRLWAFESLGVHSGRSSPPYGEVAQRLARRRREPEVAGSNPAFPTVDWVAQPGRASEISIRNAEYASMVQGQNDGFVVRRWGFESLYLLYGEATRGRQRSGNARTGSSVGIERRSPKAEVASSNLARFTGNARTTGAFRETHLTAPWRKRYTRQIQNLESART
jgi:hypothetical protein